MTESFLYFAFGSNLLRERILVRNQSAEFLTIAKLNGYRLGFGHNVPMNRWKGAVATIVESPDDHIWGCVWRLGMEDEKSLDSQEGVLQGTYQPLTVDVEAPTGKMMSCRSYQLVSLWDRDPRPSPQYLSVIQRGANQHNLPEYYQVKLSMVEHNGYKGHLKMMDDIEKLTQQ